MRYQAFGEAGNPTVVLLHGAGLSWWAYRAAALRLCDRYQVILPMIQGYGEAAGEPFQSIEQSADALLWLLCEQFGGRVFALGGLSLGAQIVVEAMSREPEIAEYAVLESALVCPMPAVRALAGPVARLSLPLARQPWFARMQAQSMRLPEALFPEYWADSIRISRETLTHTLQSNASFSIPPGLGRTRARTLILVGEREVSAEQKSAALLRQAIPGSTLCVATGLGHGELSLANPDMYAALLRAHFTRAALPISPVLHT